MWKYNVENLDFFDTCASFGLFSHPCQLMMRAHNLPLDGGRMGLSPQYMINQISIDWTAPIDFENKFSLFSAQMPNY